MTTAWIDIFPIEKLLESSQEVSLGYASQVFFFFTFTSISLRTSMSFSCCTADRMEVFWRSKSKRKTFQTIHKFWRTDVGPWILRHGSPK